MSDTYTGIYHDVYSGGTVPPDGAYTDDYEEYGGTPQPQERSSWRIFVRDGNFKRTGQVGLFSQLSATLIYCDYGNWTLALRYNDPAVELLLGERTGIEVRLGSLLVFSGPSLGILREYSKDTEMITFHGVTDDVFLSWRVCLPDPAGGINSTAQAQDVQIGPAEDMMAHFVNVNLAASARSERRLAGMHNVVSAGRGPVYTMRGRLQPLMVMMQWLARNSGLGWRVVADQEAGPRVEIALPTDRSTEVQFSRALNNITAYSWALTAPTATHIYTGLAGVGATRPFVESDDPAAEARWWRMENFLDAHDTAVPLEGLQRGQDALNQAGEQYEAHATTNPNYEGVGTQYGADWILGDFVSIVVDGIATREQVRTATLQVDATGARVAAVVEGQQVQKLLNASTASYLLQEIATLRARVLDLERNQ